MLDIEQEIFTLKGGDQNQCLHVDFEFGPGGGLVIVTLGAGVEADVEAVFRPEVHAALSPIFKQGHP